MNADFLLAGNLTIINIHNLSKPDIKCDFSTKGRGEIFASIRACVPRREGFSNVTPRGGKYYAVIKKGSNANATLWLCTRLNHTSDLALRRSTLSFRSQASSTQDENVTLGLYALSPSMLASISAINKCGKRIAFLSDLLFLLPVATFFSHLNLWGGHTPYTKNKACKTLDVGAHQTVRWSHTLSTGKAQVLNKIAKPGSGGTLTGSLTKPLYEVTIMADSQHTQTRPKFQYRFLALDRANTKAVPFRLTVEANSELEARQNLCAHFILSLAVRLPVRRTSRA